MEGDYSLLIDNWIDEIVDNKDEVVVDEVVVLLKGSTQLN
jgi:hypothetical protein